MQVWEKDMEKKKIAKMVQRKRNTKKRKLL